MFDIDEIMRRAEAARDPNSSRVSNAEIQEPFMIISATLHTLFSADAEGHFGFYYFMRKSGSLRA